MASTRKSLPPIYDSRSTEDINAEAECIELSVFSSAIMQIIILADNIFPSIVFGKAGDNNLIIALLKNFKKFKTVLQGYFLTNQRENTLHHYL